MAANYWASSQHKHWHFSKPELALIRQRLEEDNASLVQLYPLPQPRQLGIFFNQRAFLPPPPAEAASLTHAQS